MKTVDINFFVPGNPKGLKRHRTFRTKSGVNIQVDPSRSDKADFLALAMAHRPDAPLDGPLALLIVCVFQRPKAHYRKSGVMRDDAPVWYTSAPDWDNVGKFVCDALNGVFWRDDRQVAVGTVCAIYGDVPGTAVSIRRPYESDLRTALLAVTVCRCGTPSKA